MATVLVTGANGFVGKRLILTLLNEGHKVYALCRIKGAQLFSTPKSNLYYIWGDLRNPDIFNELPEDVEAAYYLVHSMAEKVADLAHAENEIVKDFINGLKGTKVKQLIYLSGIINDRNTLSPHLRSRLQVEETLKQGPIPCTVLRASIIIGEGSASFEIIRDLCEKLPIMIAPKWVHNECQPIAIHDVLFYLSKVLLNEACMGKTFDIGGPEVLTFKQLMLRYSKFRKLKTWIFDVPLLTPRLSSYWLVLITSVRFSLCSYLVESMKISTILRLNGIQQIIPHKCLTYEEALQSAFQNIAQNDVISTWMDSWGLKGVHPDIQDFIEVPKEGCLKDIQTLFVEDSKEAALHRIWAIGGNTGYYGFDWLWSLRGLIDRIFGGIGLNRGRRHADEILVGDSIDFWRVLLADKKNSHLILFANMKMPGEAWLEFSLNQEGERWLLTQAATFRPQGLLGRMYWYCLFPFHFFIFRRMAKGIAGKGL